MSVQNFSISKSIFGSEGHLCLKNAEFFWSGSEMDWHFSEENSSLNNLFKISAIDFNINNLIPQKYQNILKEISVKKGEIPLRFLLNKKDFNEFGQNIVKRIQENLLKVSNENISYYHNIFSVRKKFIEKLEMFSVDNQTVINHLENEESASNKAVLALFLERNKIEYNNYGTKTGRMTITSGPNILNLKRRYRNIFQSQFGKEGRIISIDFSSLETRLLLIESGKNISGDIYQKISDTIKNKVDRETIKKTIISLMYGASDESLFFGLPPTLQEIEKRSLIKSLHVFFKTENIISRLRKEFEKKGKITNRFGFSIKVEDGQNEDGILLNYYLQSTGADFCLIAFNDFMEEHNVSLCRPLFVIHDSLVLDVHKSYIDKIQKLTSIHSKYYDYNFPVKVEEFTNV